MPTNYTPVPGNAPAVITLPSDLDDADAESVNLAFRAVEDNLMGLAALKAAANVFTANQQEVSSNDASTPAWVVTKDSGSGGDAANFFKNIGEYKIANMSGKWRFYSGRTTGPAHAAVTCNAAWDTTAHRWFADDTGFDSIALLFEQGTGLRLSRRAAGAGTWTDWSVQTSGSFVAQGDLACNGNVATASNVTATLDITAGANVIAGGEFNYPSTKSRVTIVPLQAATSTGASVRAAGGAWELPANTRIEVPISLPNGATIDAVHFGVEAIGASADWQGDVYKVSPNYSTGGLGSLTSIASGGTTGTVTSGSEPDLVTMSGGGETVNNATTFYYVFIACAVGSVSSLLAGAVRVFWHDPGPRSF